MKIEIEIYLFPLWANDANYKKILAITPYHPAFAGGKQMSVYHSYIIYICKTERTIY